MPIQYPPARIEDTVDDFHGTPVRDPYRWLEDPDSPETRAWIEAQKALTSSFLEAVPGRESLRERLSALWDYPKRWAPMKRGSRYFQLRNSGLENQNVLWVTDGWDETGRVLLDPNTLSKDGTVAVNQWSVSPDGRYLAYDTASGGSDWQTWHVRSVETGEDLPDRIEWSKFSEAEWSKDSSGFYYGRYDRPPEGEAHTAANYGQQVFFHKIGTAQSEDILVYQRPYQKEWGFAPKLTDDGRYLVFHIWDGTDSRNRVFYRDLGGSGEVVELIPDLEAAYSFLGSDGSVLYFFSNLDAPRGKIIAIDLSNPHKDAWQTRVPEGEDTLEQVRMVNGEFICLYMHHASHRLRRFDIEGAPLGEVPLPALGAMGLVSYQYNLTGERADREMFFSFVSFLLPVTVYRYDFETGELRSIFTPDLGFDSEAYVTRQVFAPGRDGTQLPIFLTHRRDLALDGRNPTLLYGYGGFNVSMTPRFAVSPLVWLELGGVYAWSVLRGGGEYGEGWHQAGMLAHKQNVFDDFIACAEYLVKEKITTPSRLAIQGGSNGGLLVGACLNQRPDLFGAGLPAVGVMDMLRFQHFTIGWAWVSDFGSPEDPEQFGTLYAYSPYHNIRPGTEYPAVLVTTADHDDRVVPAHSFKYTAAIQAAQAGEAPVLIRIQTLAGHGLGKPTDMLIDEQGDIFAFLSAALGFPIS